MDDQKPSDQQQHSVGFLIEEYKLLLDSFWRSEELGERRVNFFITLTAAAVAALVAIGEKGISVSDGKVDFMFFYGLGAMLMFGVVTLVRIVRRNLESHKYIRAAGRIRRYFTERDEQIRPHLYFEPRDDKPVREKRWREVFLFGTGGLIETVALVNSLVVATLCALLALCHPGRNIWLDGLVGFIATWIAQFIYVKYRYDKARPKKDEIRFPGD